MPTVAAATDLLASFRGQALRSSLASRVCGCSICRLKYPGCRYCSSGTKRVVRNWRIFGCGAPFAMLSGASQLKQQQMPHHRDPRHWQASNLVEGHPTIEVGDRVDPSEGPGPTIAKSSSGSVLWLFTATRQDIRLL